MARTPIGNPARTGRITPTQAEVARGGRRTKARATGGRFSTQRLLKLGYSVAAIGLMALVIIFVVGLFLYGGEAQKSPAQRNAAANNPAAMAQRLATPTPDRSKVPAKAVGPEELAQMIASGDVLVVDARPTASWLQGHIPGTTSMPHYHLQGQAENLPRNKLIVTVCDQQTCPQGEEAARLIIARGLDNVGYLRGGFEAWQAAGLPVE